MESTRLLSERIGLKDKFPGAVGQEDPFGVFCEAKRNLTALVAHVHGEIKWEKLQHIND